MVQVTRASSENIVKLEKLQHSRLFSCSFTLSLHVLKDLNTAFPVISTALASTDQGGECPHISLQIAVLQRLKDLDSPLPVS